MVSKLEQRLAAKTQGLGRGAESEPAGKQPPGPAPDNGPNVPAESALAEAPASAAAPSATTTAPPPRVPRTPVTMPGQLGAFRNEAQKYLDQLAEKDAIIEELRSSSDRVQRIKLSLVDDSPYQPRLEYDPEEIDALAKTMAASTQADPIKVRKVGDRYELISGHRRKRAALSLGWTEIDAIVENRTDEQAELEAMLLVVGSVSLSDYELAKMYRRAQQRKFWKGQREAAAMFGTSQTLVSQRLDMLSLPAPILEMLEAKPSLFGADCGKTIKNLVKEFPDHIDLIVKGVRRLVEENAPQNSLKGWVLQAISQKGRKASPPDNSRTITTGDGRAIFTTKKHATSLTVNFKAKNFDDAKFERDFHQWLSEYAKKADAS